ncbi:MAG: efflux transporter outer membrane subunit [Planctomycetota bacterium]
MNDRVFAVLFVAALSSCRTVVGPDYERPSVELPDSWAASDDVPEDAAAMPDEWWLALGDPALDRIVELVLSDSPSLEESFARWEESLAVRSIAAADRLPTADLRYERRRDSGSEAFFPAGGGIQDTYTLGLDASFEPDLFGRIRRTIEAADADIEARRADLEDLWRVLAADTAATYVDLRTIDAQLELARANLAIQEETLALVKAQQVSGLADQLSVDRAQADASETEARIPQLEADARGLARRLAVLAGRTYPELPVDLREALEQPRVIPAAPPLPSLAPPAEIAERRPDLRRLERDLAAQTARIGAAVADLYPSVTLFGFAGVSAPEQDQLFESLSRTWGFGPRFTWNVFDRRRIKNRVSVEEARADQARARFERAVLEAWDEVEDFALRYANEETRLARLRTAAESSARAVELAREQYAAGLVDLQVVLDTQRVLLGLSEQFAASQGALTKNWIALGRATSAGRLAIESPSG